jgi:hypothetical protein
VTPSNLKQIRKSVRDLKIHRICFDLDLNKEEVDEAALRSVNLVK